ncbi:DEAD/DEAH box helicase [Balneatrix alpica]|uniref:ATP-dependent RNA helicase RhlE n=1 Tax=Balneatrix alpica TaxID=75684 RepID=A0ABV5ZC84_9GAMM
MSFASLGLSSPLLQAIAKQGYEQPSPIQLEAIPAVLQGGDLMAAAQTGTGKTAAFTLPLLQRLDGGPQVKANQIRALVLTPTRELAAQVHESVQTYGQHLSLRSAVVFGGVKINPQMIQLRRGVDILVATPGRLLDLYQQNAVRFNQLEILVLDEADRMLDLGFIHDIRKILALLPAKRQNLLFSATFSAEIRQLAKGLLQQPLEVSVTPANSTTTQVEQWLYPVAKKHKAALLHQLIQQQQWHQLLVFTKTKHGANRLSQFLEKQGLKAAAIHGNKSQGARTKALAGFKQGSIQILVATDIAARGLDIEQLPLVVNYELPTVPADYVHRIGRTGRAGATGQAISLVETEEAKQLKDIERLIGQHLERRQLPGFALTEELPQTDLSRGPKKPKKAKPSAEASNEKAGESRPAASQPRKPRPAKPAGERSGDGQAPAKSKRPQQPKPHSSKPHASKQQSSQQQAPKAARRSESEQVAGDRQPRGRKPNAEQATRQRSSQQRTDNRHASRSAQGYGQTQGQAKQQAGQQEQGNETRPSRRPRARSAASGH